MSLTPPPTAPAPTDSTADFDTKSFALVAWFATFVTQITAEIANMIGYVASALGYANAAASSASAAATSATASATSATASAASAATSAASANVTLWISGSTYTAGAMVQDPGDAYTVYVRQITGAGATQPHADTTNWRVAFPIGKPLAVLTPTAAAALDALSVFTSEYDNYLIVYEGIANASGVGAEILRIRFANAGTVDTASNYLVNSAASGYLETGPTFLGTGLGGAGGAGEVRVFNTNDATNIKTALAHGVANSTAGTYQESTAYLAYTKAAAISGFRLYWSGGSNFAAQGKVFVYGLKNA